MLLFIIINVDPISWSRDRSVNDKAKRELYVLYFYSE